MKLYNYYALHEKSIAVKLTEAGSSMAQAVMDNPEHKKYANSISVVDLGYGAKPLLAAALAGGALAQDKKLIVINLPAGSEILKSLSQKYPNEILILKRVWEFLQAMWAGSRLTAVSA